jgi:quercetin dioxygenase-like cupin family protein
MGERGREVLSGVGGTRYVVRLDGATTGGHLAVVDCHLPAGAVGAAPHVHRDHVETFQVVSGIVTFDLGDADAVDLGQDEWVSAPRGVRHGFGNRTDAPAVVRFLLTPAGYEDYFREVSRLVEAGAEPTPDDLAVMRARYGTTTG